MATDFISQFDAIFFTFVRSQYLAVFMAKGAFRESECHPRTPLNGSEEKQYELSIWQSFISPSLVSAVFPATAVHDS
ncbi:hypothetical protein VDGD_20624 [Verticillium dahliae]|nr:hypothetical protein VDGD_20624 [Verticillium dahliae]